MTSEIPLFPLNAVLFPGGLMQLRIFEQRYMDMAKTCLKDGAPFGICLIAEGEEVGEAATPHAVGTLARIVSWDMEQLGVLTVKALGGGRFRIRERRSEASGLQMAGIEHLAPEAATKVPAALTDLLPLLRGIVADMGGAAPPTPHRFDDAVWVGYRFCEVLPIPALARQKLLELEDSISRLQIIARFLQQKGLLPAS